MRVAHIDKTGTKAQVGSDIFIVPTDDERLKIVLIPYDAIGAKVETIDQGSLISQVQRVIKNSEVTQKGGKCNEIWVPAFKI